MSGGLGELGWGGLVLREGKENAHVGRARPEGVHVFPDPAANGTGHPGHALPSRSEHRVRYASRLQRVHAECGRQRDRPASVGHTADGSAPRAPATGCPDPRVRAAVPRVRAGRDALPSLGCRCYPRRAGSSHRARWRHRARLAAVRWRQDRPLHL
eukprot:6124431-Pleurochrysis_carterae.AAC.1